MYKHADRYNKKNRLIAEINVIPYIDVMLVLLVIFMITAPLLTQGVNVNLPKANSKAITIKTAEPIIMSVDSQGRYFLNIDKHPAKPIQTKQLTNEVSNRLKTAKTKNQKVNVYIKGDRFVSYGKIMQAMVLLQKAGADNVGLITEKL